MADTLESSTQLEKLRCALCKNSLSYFPIKICHENGENICGRCSVPEEASSKYICNDAYETAAYFLQFPCRYKDEGCAKSMSPQKVPNHERICRFQVVTCAVKKRTHCTWEGGLPKLLQHCREKHPDLFLKDGEFQMDLSESHDFENFVEHEGMLLVIARKFSSTNREFLFSVRYFEYAVDVEDMYYRIVFTNKNKSFHVDGNATVFDEDGGSGLNEIFLDSLKNPTNDSASIFVKITVDQALEHEQISSEKKLNEDLLSQLKCSGCSDYVMPPVWHSQDQVYCSECRMKLAIANETRNVSLDKLASLLDYPCKYWKNGCSFISKADRMVKHQTFCLKGIYPCPVKEYSNCKWEGSGENFVVHLQQEHSNFMIRNSSELTENVDDFAGKSTNQQDLTLGVSVGIVTGSTPVSTIKTIQGLTLRVPSKPMARSKGFFAPSIVGTPKHVSNQNDSLSSKGLFGEPTFGTTISNQNTSIAVTNNIGQEEACFEKCYIIPFLNRLFRLTFAVKHIRYSWAVQAIGNFSEEFKYELEITDKTGRGRRMLVRHPCSPLTKQNEIFMDADFFCYYPTSYMKKYFLSPQNDVTFKITIVK